MTRQGEGGYAAFPTTAVSKVLALRSADPEARAAAFGLLAAAYLVPVYKYARRSAHRSEEEAEEIANEFFATALEKGTFAGYEPEKARFRTFLRVCLDRFIANGIRRDRAKKRGGDVRIASFDFDAVERELASSPDEPFTSPEEYFDRQWTRELLRSSLETLKADLEAKNKLVHYHVLQRIDLCEDGNPPSYAELGAAIGLSASDVTNRLSYARRAFRRVVLEKLRELTASDQEFREEARAVLGIDPE